MEEGGNKVNDFFFGGTERHTVKDDFDDRSITSSFHGGNPNNKMTAFANRMTLNQIRERNTVLKNVGQGKDDSTSQSKEELLLFRRITSLIEDHLHNKKHCFSTLINMFQDFIVKKYESGLVEAKTSSEEQVSKITTELSGEINSFIQVLVKAVILFYNFDVCKFKIYYETTKSSSYVPCDTLNFENLMNFVTVLMFPKRIYKIVFSYLNIKWKEKNKRLNTKKSKHFDAITLQSLGVLDYFILPKCSPSAMKKKKSVRKFSLFNEVYEEDREEEINLRRSLAQSEAESQDLKQRLLVPKLTENTSSRSNALLDINLEDGEAYHEPITALNYIPLVESPFEKMKVLLTVIKKLIRVINEYHRSNGNKQEVLTGDQIMGLVVYIVSRSNCPTIVTHLEFVELFLPRKFFNTFCGYYLTVFNAACEYLSEYKTPEERKEEEANRSDDFDLDLLT